MAHKWQRMAFVAGLALIALVVSPGILGSQPARAQPKQLTVGMWSSPGSFNPISNPSGYSDAIIALVFDPLVEHNHRFEYVPGLAQGWEVSADAQRFVFHLHPEARWHDGQPVTADDVVFTFTVQTDPETVTVHGSAISLLRGTGTDGKALAAGFDGVEKVDENTVVFHTKAPVPEEVFLERIGVAVRIVPQHLLKDVAPGELHTHRFGQDPIGSGPFRFVQYRPDQYVEVARHEAYHKETPHLDRIFVRIVPGPTMLAALERGEVDVTAGGGIGELPITDWERAGRIDGLKLVPYTPMVYQTMVINHNVPQFDDVRVRQALALAIDRERMKDSLLRGLAELHPTPLNSNNRYFNEDLVETIRHDPAEARRLLEEAGWDFNRRVVILTPTGNVVRERSATLIQADLQAVGIRAEIERADFATAYARMIQGDYDLGLLGSRSSFDPDLTQNAGSEGDSNYTGYASPKMDALLEEARLTLDGERRRGLYDEIQTLYAEEVPQIILYSPLALTVVSERVVNAMPGANGRAPVGLFWNPEQWDLQD